MEAIVDRFYDCPTLLFCEIWSGSEKAQITYGELGERSREFADTYRRHGLRSGDVAFIMLTHCADLYPAFLGAMLIGAIPSFLPFPNPKQNEKLFWESHIAVFRRSGAKLLLTYPALVSQIADRADEKFTILTSDDVYSDANEITYNLPDELQTALLQHSSGTTGLKKGVMLSYRAIADQIDEYSNAVDFTIKDSIVASWLPLYHDMGLISCFLMPMMVGVPIVSLNAFEWTNRPFILLEAIESSRATHVWLPNFALAHIARATPKSRHFDLSSLKAIIGCSEPNRPATIDQFVNRFREDGIRPEHMQTCYAMAETVFAVSQTSIGNIPRRLKAAVEGGRVEGGQNPKSQVFLSNGRAIGNMEVRILHDGRLYSDGVAGELCFRAPYLFDGYFKDPELTRASFIDGFFRTGDIGFLEQGEIFIFGRIKELIIVNGRNFFAHDIEAVVSDVEGIKKGRCVAFGVLNPIVGSEQIVVVAERDGAELEDQNVVGAVSLAMNFHFGTNAGDIRLVEAGWLTKTTSGKTSRAENARKYKLAFRNDAQILLLAENLH